MKKLLTIAVLVTSTVFAQSVNGTAALDMLIGRLPEPYRAATHRYLALNEGEALRIKQQMDSNQLAGDQWVVMAFAGVFDNPEGRGFLMKRLDDEVDGNLRLIILEGVARSQQYVLARPERLLSEPDLQVIQKHAESDSDPNAAAEAWTIVHRVHLALESRTLEARRKQGDAPSLDALYWHYWPGYVWFSDAPRNPFFNYKPPSVFHVPTEHESLRVLAFGDFGTGSADQRQDAAAMLAYHQQHPFDLGLALGDNFYPAGLNSPDSPRWQSDWEKLYGPLGIQFYPVYGNHEYVDPDSPAAEIAYSAKSKTWVFPAAYYTFTAGPAQFFAIDTIRLTQEELAWLDLELRKSTARWKIVYGHYPIYSGGSYGDNHDLIASLLPVLERNHVEIYLNGHDHNMQEVRTDSSVHFFTSGAGGAPLYDLASTYKRSVFRDKQLGFTVLELDAQHADVIFVDETGKEIYRSPVTD